MPEPLDSVRLAAALSDRGYAGPAVDLRAVTGSTNADLVALAVSGAPHATVVVAETQTLGRGRSTRRWVAPTGSGLTVSMLLRGPVPVSTSGWIPLWAGLCVVEAVRPLLGDAVGLKWPNDVVVTDARGVRKLGGLLVEVAEPEAYVIGLGINVHLRADELPVPTATSLDLELPGAVHDRTEILAAVLASWGRAWDRWVSFGGDPHRSGVRDRVRAVTSTLGTDVRVTLPGPTGQPGDLRGVAVDLDEYGRLVVAPHGSPNERVSVSAGDVEHVRPDDTRRR